MLQNLVFQIVKYDIIIKLHILIFDVYTYIWMYVH